MTDATPKPPLTDPALLRDTILAALAEPDYWDADGYNTITEFHRDEWRLILDLIGEGIAARLQAGQDRANDLVRVPVPGAAMVRTEFYECGPEGYRRLPGPRSLTVYETNNSIPLPEPWPVTPNGVLMEPGDRTIEDADSRFAEDGGTLVTDERPEPGGGTGGVRVGGAHPAWSEPLAAIERAQADQDWTHPTPITGSTGTVTDPTPYERMYSPADLSPPTTLACGIAPAPTPASPLPPHSRPRLSFPGWKPVNPDAPREPEQPDASQDTTRGGNIAPATTPSSTLSSPSPGAPSTPFDYTDPSTPAYPYTAQEHLECQARKQDPTRGGGQ